MSKLKNEIMRQRKLKILYEVYKKKSICYDSLSIFQFSEIDLSQLLYDILSGEYDRNYHISE